MGIDYQRLWKRLEEQGMKKIQLQRDAKISGNIFARLGNDEYVSLGVIEKICKTLNCSVDNI